MVHSALSRCKLFCGTNEALSRIQFPILPGAGLLYPSRQAKTLGDLPASEKPRQLIIVDGTWTQARTMLRDLEQLNDLPHFKLAPTQPGRYRIRLEPTDTSLSTVEAAVAALRETEPETSGLDQLLVAFEGMVQRQLDHPRVGREHYSGGPKSGSTINIPRRLLGDADSIVVAYGETGYRAVNSARTEQTDRANISSNRRDSFRIPLYWVAQRLGSSETDIHRTYSCALKPDVPLTDSFLTHLELSRNTFDNALSPERFRQHWRTFLRQGDTLVVYNQGSIGLLENVGADFETCLALNSIALKSINFDQCRPRRTLSQFVEQEKQVCEAVNPSYGPEHGRAGKRLANAIALVKYLRQIAVDT